MQNSGIAAARSAKGRTDDPLLTRAPIRPANEQKKKVPANDTAKDSSSTGVHVCEDSSIAMAVAVP